MGPVATQMLGDYGADVIKIERPPTGDLSRTSIPDDPAGLVGPVYCSLNRNKRSVVLDLQQAGGPRRPDGPDPRRRRGGEQFPRRRDGAHGPRLRRTEEDQSAADLCGRHRLRPHRPLRAQGRAGRAGAGDVRRDGAPLARERSALGLRHDLRGLFGRHASGAGRAARAAAAGEDRAGPAVQRVAARLDDRGADPGGRHADDARQRAELGRDAACPACSRPATARW